MTVIGCRYLNQNRQTVIFHRQKHHKKIYIRYENKNSNEYPENRNDKLDAEVFS